MPLSAPPRAFLLSSLIITTFGFLTAACEELALFALRRAFRRRNRTTLPDRSLHRGPMRTFELRRDLRTFPGLPVGFDILAEAMPSSGRGKFGLYMEFFWTAGSLYVTAIAWLLLEQVGWQVFTGAAAIPTLVASLAGYFSLPESPRWLVDMDRGEEALEIVKKWAKRNGNDMRHEQLIKSAHHTDNVSVMDLFRRSALRWKTFAHGVVWQGPKTVPRSHKDAMFRQVLTTGVRHILFP
ncbi:Slc22a3 [Symbiodinium natans]|uniref:Slc22a3 protein n=1 Tax=Symbiodinium natans TaxID=878477 RepID=A0A812KJZ1_9DINO|nr:Slc22a3 [Symbiodinium natans]